MSRKTQSRQGGTSNRAHQSTTSGVTWISLYCDKFIEAGWLATLVLAPMFMNIYTHRMFEPDKNCVIRSVALLMLVAWVIKTIELRTLPKLQVTSHKSRDTRYKIQNTIFLSVLIFAASYVLSTIFTQVPYRTSIFGSYDRLQGLYSFTFYLVIFLLAATHLRQRAQLERLVTVVIFTAIPIMLYAFIQRCGWDVIPWVGVDPSKRVSATMGNPIFFAAYLVMVAPLVLSRIIKSFNARTKTSNFLMVFYSLVLLMIFSSVVLARSRGPMAGLLLGLFVYLLILAIKQRRKLMLYAIIILGVMGAAFLVVFNLPNTPLESLKRISSLEPLSRLTNFKPGTSGRTRMVLWTGAASLVREAPWSTRLTGYGPESLGTVFYKQHTAELTKLEGKTVHGDRCHMALLDVLVMRGIIGLMAYFFLIASFFYFAFKALWRTKDRGYELLLFGIIAAVTGQLLEAQVSFYIVVTYTHFWLFLAAIWAIYRLTISVNSVTSIDSVSSVNAPLPQDSTQRTHLQTKQSNEQNGPGLGFYIFWTYMGLTLVMAVIIVKDYWPGIDTNTSIWIIGIWFWILLGILLGAFAIRRTDHESFLVQGRFVHFNNFVSYLIMIGAAVVIIIFSNLQVILADGFYKFHFTFDQEATRLVPSRFERLKPGNFLAAYQVRIRGVSKIQEAIRYAPYEKVYLNGAGRNFMELANLVQRIPSEPRHQANIQLAKMKLFNEIDFLRRLDNMIPAARQEYYLKDKLGKMSSLKEVLSWPPEKFAEFSQRDFFKCCFVCIQTAYQLEPGNLERIIALARTYRYWARLDRDISRYQQALELYQEAKRVSPYRTSVYDEEKKTKQQMQQLQIQKLQRRPRR